MRRIFLRPQNVLIVSNGVALLLGVVSAAIQARILGPIGRGELASAMVPATILAMLLCLGLPDYLARRVAMDGDAKRAATLALSLSAAIGILFTGPYLLLIGTLEPMGSQAWWLFVVYACLTPVFVYGYCITGIAVGQASWGAVSISKILPQTISVVGLFFLLGKDASVTDVGVLLIGSSLAGLVLPATVARARPFDRIALSDVRSALSFGLKGWGAGALALLNQRVDLLMLTALASNQELGYYAVATTLASVLGTVPTSIAMPVRNRVARGEMGAAVKAVAVSMALSAAGALLLSAGLPWVVPFVLGEAFVPAIPVMIVLVFAQIPLAGVIVLTYALVGAGKPGAPVLGEAAAFLSTVVAILVLFPLYGMLAASLANFAANLISLTVLLVLAKRHLSNAPIWRYFLLSPTTLLGALSRKDPHGSIQGGRGNSDV